MFYKLLFNYDGPQKENMSEFLARDFVHTHDDLTIHHASVCCWTVARC